MLYSIGLHAAVAPYVANAATLMYAITVEKAIALIATMTRNMMRGLARMATHIALRAIVFLCSKDWDEASQAKLSA